MVFKQKKTKKKIMALEAPPLWQINEKYPHFLEPFPKHIDYHQNLKGIKTF